MADGATADPAAEQELLDTARKGSFGELSRKARARKAAALGDDEARARAAHRNRSFSTGTNALGEGWGRFNEPAHLVARLNAQLKPFLDQVFAQARREGRRERPDAYAFDAFMAFAGLLDLEGLAGDEDAGRGPADTRPAGAGSYEPGTEPGTTGDAPTGARSGPGTHTGAGRREARPDPSNDERAEPERDSHTSPEADAAASPTAADRGETSSAPAAPEGAAKDGSHEDAGPVAPAPTEATLPWEGAAPAGYPPDRRGDGHPPGRTTGVPPPGPPPNAPARRPTVRPDTRLILRVDATALQRGHTVAGETCDIAGLGPISVADLKALLPDAAIDVVITNGVDVFNVTHFGRRANARQQVVLDLLNIGCTREGCNATQHLQVDHRIDWHKIKITELANLDWLCPHDHDLKTHHGWQLEPGTGKRPMRPPGEQPWLDAAGAA